LVTNGARDVYLWADSPLFGKVPMQTLPVSAAVGKALKEGRKGDSTGCGDNFAGGVIASIAKQLSHVSPLSRRGVGGEALNSHLSLIESTKWGIVSGGFACFYYGGTYIEKKEGEKLTLLQELYDQY
jgi:sugar/nucleoside kinase (ribokinase family)